MPSSTLRKAVVASAPSGVTINTLTGNDGSTTKSCRCTASSVIVTVLLASTIAVPLTVSVHSPGCSPTTA